MKTLDWRMPKRLFTWRRALATAIVPVLASCTTVTGAPSGEGRPVNADGWSVDAEGLERVSAQALEACGAGGVESVRVVVVRRADGASDLPEAHFVCKDGGEAVGSWVRRYALDTCGKDNVAGTSVTHHSSGAVQSVGFRCTTRSESLR